MDWATQLITAAGMIKIAHLINLFACLFHFAAYDIGTHKNLLSYILSTNSKMLIFSRSLDKLFFYISEHMNNDVTLLVFSFAYFTHHGSLHGY